MSPQPSRARSDLDKLCVGLPAKAEMGSVVGVLMPVTAVQDVPVLSAAQNQQCAEKSTRAKGDEPLSHILDNIPVASDSGATNS